MIILEGPDNMGKTTLAEAISQNTGLKIMKSGGPFESKEQAEDRMKTVFLDNNTIWDRVPCISEPIFGHLIRNEHWFDGTTWLEDLVRHHRPLLIYCRLPTTLALRLSHEGKSHEGELHLREVEKNQLAIMKAYDEFMNNLNESQEWGFVLYDWSSYSPREMGLLTTLVRALHQRWAP